MFDKFHLTFYFQSKVSRDVLKNKNECQLTSTSYSKISPQLSLTQYLKKTNILKNQYAILICNKQTKQTKKKRKKENLSIERKYPLVLHVSRNVEDGSPIHCINFEPTNRNPHKSIKGLQVQPIAQVAFDCILFGKSSFTLPCLVTS